jgi:hypothetical protein
MIIIMTSTATLAIFIIVLLYLSLKYVQLFGHAKKGAINS